MKKRMNAVILPAMLLGLICASAPAAAADGTGTADNWSVKLTFSTPNHADLLPLTIGQNATTREVMKPPPMPGKAVTLNADDAIINAYVKSSSKKVAESVSQPAADAPGTVWAIEINAEEPNTAVSVTPDLSAKYSGYNLSIIDPETGIRTALSTTNSPVTIFTTDGQATPKTLYVLASSSKSFAVAGSTKLRGAVGMARMADGAMLGGISVYIDGSNKGQTADAGTFEIPSLSPGTHDIKIDGANLLASTGTITVAADGTAAVALNDPMGGDANDDGTISMADFTVLKKCFNKNTATGAGAADGTNQCTPEKLLACNFNRDAAGDCNMQDFTVLKLNFNKQE